MSRDIYQKTDGKWYCSSTCYGDDRTPFDTRVEAEAELSRLVLEAGWYYEEDYAGLGDDDE